MSEQKFIAMPNCSNIQNDNLLEIEARTDSKILNSERGI